ncbi:MAG: hypothetical protein ACKPCM_14530 [Pseudanabaena sp.]
MLTGSDVVTVYSKNEYQFNDLDIQRSVNLRLAIAKTFKRAS